MKYTYFFDNNIYQRLTRSPDGQALRTFNKSIKESEIGTIASGEVIYQTTPYTLIEALGVVVPNPNITIPENLYKEKDITKIVDYVLIQAKEFFKETAEIKKEYFLAKAQEQTKFVSYEGKILENMFINSPLSDPYLEENIINALAFDYLCKFEFEPNAQLKVFQKFLIPAFFFEHHGTTGLSKFRIAKKLWETVYHNLINKSSYPKQDVEEMNKSMKLKKFKDFVDCEIIHFACVGNYTDKQFSPVVVYTCDDVQTVIDRVMAYKSILQMFNRLLEETFSDKFIEKTADWKQGVLVFCNTDGSFKGIVKVNEIDPFL